MRRGRWLALVVVVALLLAGCGGDSDGSPPDSAGASEATATPEPTTPPDEDSAAPEDGGDSATADGDSEQSSTAESGTSEESTSSADAPEESDAVESEEPEEEVIELTATARGVTADTITLGVAITDVTVFADVGDILARYQPLVDVTNAAGGINGRQVEIITEQWDILDSVAFEAACVALTEDNEVFLVLGFMPAGWGSIFCYIDLNETIVINTSDLDQQDLDMSDGRLITTRPYQFGSLLAGLELLRPELEGARVVIYGASVDGRIETAEKLLRSFGAEILEVTRQQIGGEDLIAAEAEIDIHVERWRTHNPDWIINVDGAVAGSLQGLERAGLTDWNIVTPANDAPSNNAMGADLSLFSNLIATGEPGAEELAAQGLYGIPECFDIINAATDQGLGTSGKAEDAQAGTAIEVCAAWDVFVALATAAGPNLTPESFLQAGYDLGSFPMTGSPSGSLAPDKPWVSNAQPALFVYDAELDAFVPR
ncbi:MAG: ABC transporter substrate-binding protein [Acidimicrobiia bacterium]|nr:ABC transporter substrate-binding protein [Acidimicrobiia bacterium]MYG71618.1 ABC transporter substrate-binding protein [Acidimicrobiia bacterium]